MADDPAQAPLVLDVRQHSVRSFQLVREGAGRPLLGIGHPCREPAQAVVVLDPLAVGDDPAVDRAPVAGRQLGSERPADHGLALDLVLAHWALPPITVSGC